MQIAVQDRQTASRAALSSRPSASTACFIYFYIQLCFLLFFIYLFICFLFAAAACFSALFFLVMAPFLHDFVIYMHTHARADTYTLTHARRHTHTCIHAHVASCFCVPFTCHACLTCTFYAPYPPRFALAISLTLYPSISLSLSGVLLPGN